MNNELSHQRYYASGFAVLIERLEREMDWSELEVSLCSISTDWFGEELSNPLSFSLAVDGVSLWFVARHDVPAQVHPEAKKGEFQPELWKYDVAEFFLLDPASGRYLEFNLAPNGAWWSACFSGARVVEVIERPRGVETFTETTPNEGWTVAASIPLAWLKSELGFGEQSKMNVAFIVESPEQKFVSVCPLGGESPDFHQPADFGAVSFF